MSIHRAQLVVLSELVLGWLICHGASVAFADDDSLTAARARLDRQFNAAVMRLIDDDSDEQRKRARQKALIERDPSRQYFHVPPGLLPSPATESPAVTLDAALDRLRRVYAQQLFELARRAANVGDGPTAIQWVNETLYFDIEHNEARRATGLDAGPTRASGKIVKVRRGKHRHPRLQWAAGEYLQADTPHFRITTNHSEEATRELAFTLEELNFLWQQVFFDFWSHSRTLQATLAGRPLAQRRRAKHQVIFFQQRDQYVDFLSKLEPQAKMTLGYYHAPSRVAVFYGDATPSNRATWRHEATHQLFHEKRNSRLDVGESGHFWIVEGIALYMESIQSCRGLRTLGGLEADRLQFARYRALREGFYEPLHRFSALGRAELQQDPRIRQLYSQAAGLTHFLMDFQQGRYRRALGQYIRAVYDRQADQGILARLTKSENLDEQYIDFLQVEDADLKQLEPEATIRNLSLGDTRVSDEGLLALPHLHQLLWLDLKGTRVTDAGTVHFDAAERLKQLSLEDTKIGDVTLRRLAHAKQLEELDLTNTQITDDATSVLGQLRNLKTLWLTGTRISDAGIHELRPLSRLQTLDVSKTDVTPAGWSRLRTALPELRTR